MGVDLDGAARGPRGRAAAQAAHDPAGPSARARSSVTQRLARLLEAAEREARRLKDEYVSVEHLLVALADEGRRTRGRAGAGPHGVTRDAFLAALTQVRGNQRVTSATPEGAYEALDEVRAGPGRSRRVPAGWTR